MSPVPAMAGGGGPERLRAFAALAACAAVAISSISVLALSAHPVPEGRPAELRAYFNGEEATVVDATVAPGQPCVLELAVEVNAPLDYLVLRVCEPGADAAYALLEGSQSTVLYDVPAGARLWFRWVVAPNGNWTGGLAPIQLFYAMRLAGEAPYPDGVDPAVRGTFAFANPYIRG